MQTHNTKTAKKKPSKLEQAVVFFFVWMGIAGITFGFFALIDFLPEKADTEDTTPVEEVRNVREGRGQEPTDPVEDVPVGGPLPRVIVFDSLDKEVQILNPQERSVSALDNALLSGVVRHPDSADFQNTGTIFLLGHSSYLPVVNNKNFQAFNGIQNLKWGDTIRLHSDDTEYIYSVERVYEAKATEAMVPIQYGKPTLTLATCNSFGTKDDRFIVEATLVSKKPLSV